MNLNNLDKQLKTLTGTPVMMDEKTPLTYRTALLLACETYNPATRKPGSMLQAYKVGTKILEAKDTLELSDDEHNILTEAVESTQSFVAIVIGRLLEFINNKQK